MYREHTIAKICEDMEIAKWWFHCSLIVDSSTEGLHCQHCGKPRSEMACTLFLVIYEEFFQLFGYIPLYFLWPIGLIKNMDC